MSSGTAAALASSAASPASDKPQASLGGYTPLGAYVPMLIVFSMAPVPASTMPMVLAG